MDTEHIFSEATLLEAVSLCRFCGSGETVIFSESIVSSKISSASSHICAVLTNNARCDKCSSRIESPWNFYYWRRVILHISHKYSLLLTSSKCPSTGSSLVRIIICIWYPAFSDRETKQQNHFPFKVVCLFFFEPIWKIKQMKLLTLPVGIRRKCQKVSRRCDLWAFGSQLTSLVGSLSGAVTSLNLWLQAGGPAGGRGRAQRSVTADKRVDHLLACAIQCRLFIQTHLEVIWLQVFVAWVATAGIRAPIL